MTEPSGRCAVVFRAYLIVTGVDLELSASIIATQWLYEVSTAPVVGGPEADRYAR